jgi:AcrR family transcriptional regulator
MPPMPRRPAAAVAATRDEVTRAAVDRASVEGLEGLTIGGLADQVEMRKSSVFTLFGSKRDLQLATLETAVEQFREEVWQRAESEPPGLPRLLALTDAWLDYHRREVMPGGCFLTTATIEYDARPGPLRDAVARTMRRWLEALESESATAIEAGELPPGTDPADIAFQLNSLAAGASYGFQLWRDPEVFARARRSMRGALGVS